MKVTPEMLNLISDMERDIGSSCYNPYTRTHSRMFTGKDIRYPHRHGKYDMSDTIDLNRIFCKGGEPLSEIEKVYYSFGANNLYVIDAIVKLLNTIEQRYGIDFEQLEHERMANAEQE